METTTIRISKEVRDMLKAIGRKDETYDDLLRRLIEENQGKEKGEMVREKNIAVG